ncbi:MAG: dihydroorotate dehydrogenase B catalytic subunit [Omnitrophica WOR_2 bacterium GWF2_43_52]|nr:MAG: dihydroorotate dehydrogenase B catalytic subunit [Omnitrophica WOR_2 bacterium GWC2_44_8]OGX20400.1 MAG: dihydroorotate dehydrogenase B catalytic subunit [Omnitrophica WOR_2 bacterium GWF2_43_52]HAH20670.1 dihydroorotate dehydrogenase [Candidatus Omnitrophota bacterium]HBG63001.1 dihydroorotate dehydrogenase [Candidatus Omnitrophota bacterium]
MKPNLKVKIGKMELQNPVMVASGTFGYAEEFKDFVDLKKLGVIVTKTITLKPRQGNPPPRTCETPAGMLNSIGLENPGMEKFIQEKLPFLKKTGVPIIVSIASESDTDEFITLARRLDAIKEVSAIELNISCPNIHEGRRARDEGRLVSQNPQATYEVVKAVRNVTRKTLITKLSPNVTDITEIALAAERAGTDAVALINTLMGMSINVKTRKPKIAMVTAGLSGPAIRPVAMRMVWEVYQKVKIPIIGMGGIMDTESALEFFLAGASAISVGTANFINPKTTIDIIAGLKKYLEKHKISGIKALVGSLII